MATFSITTTPDQDSATKYACDVHNAQTSEALTPLQFARLRIGQFLDGFVDRWQRETGASKGQAYRKATVAAAAGDATAVNDVATMDTILAKYQ